MQVVLSFATVMTKGFEFNEKIEFLSRFEDVSGIEIFGQELDVATLNDRSIDILNGFSENSIHMPNRGVYDASEECRVIVGRIVSKARQFNVNKLLFHSHQIQDYKYVFWDGFISAIENAPDGKKKIGLQTVEENRVLLDKHPGLKLVLDPTHALVNSIPPKDFLKLKDRINSVQLSGIGQIGGDSTDHLPLYKTPKNILAEIQPVLGLDVPFVLESGLEDPSQDIPKEIDFIKNKFDKI